ncbi:MAG: DGQHR domain-containing protein [bacterium]|nr:DGQHR domain-containing protein [bacterium]
MTEIYPAIKARMGRWDYFMVRMSMRDLARTVKYAEDIHGATQLSDAIQRELNKSRAAKEIATYLVKQEDRFFSSIVVAALRGDPQWHPVNMEDDPQFSILMSDKSLSGAFGVLTFNGEQDYFALDGQHRLSAIRALMDDDGRVDLEPPEGFAYEHVPVIIVIPHSLELEKEFMVRYRRLFGNLNRHAKAMSQFDNIVMDEDDIFAIITRRLIVDHEFFRSPGKDTDSSRIKMKRSKNISSGSSHWSSLEALYEINIRLLNTAPRRNEGWGLNAEKINDYKRFRPDEEDIDTLAQELTLYWDALVDTLPVLRSDPARMRIHNSRTDEQENEKAEDEARDNVLFWPITQELLADLARALLDDAAKKQPDSGSILTLEQAKTALEPLNSIVWDAHQPPWRHVFLVQNPKKNGQGYEWRIANEDRTERIRLLERIVRWQLRLDQLSDMEISGPGGLREVWRSLLPLEAVEEEDDMWEKIKNGVQV